MLKLFSIKKRLKSFINCNCSISWKYIISFIFISCVKIQMILYLNKCKKLSNLLLSKRKKSINLIISITFDDIMNVFNIVTNESIKSKKTWFNIYKAVYERVIDIVISAYWLRSKNYYVELHFLKALNRGIFWKEF